MPTSLIWALPRNTNLSTEISIPEQESHVWWVPNLLLTFGATWESVSDVMLKMWHEMLNEMIANYSEAQSRRDDMESLGYLTLYLLRVSLPWQKITATTTERKLELIQEMREKISTWDLCNGLPKLFAAYLDHVRSLQFGGKTRYSYLRRIFNNIFGCEGFKWDQVFDWTSLKHSMAQSSAGDRFSDSLWSVCKA